MEFVDNYISFVSSVTLMSILGFLLIRSVISSNYIALLIVLFKFGLFCFYFLFLSNYKPVLLSDDYNYYHESLSVFQKGHGNLWYIFTKQGHLEMILAAGGRHYGYYIYNYVSFVFFGPYYYSPVLLSVFVTLVTTTIIFKTLELVYTSRLFLVTFFIFYSCHWDVIAWSNFVNLKDNLVTLWTVTVMYIYVYFYHKGFSLWRFLLLVLIIFLFQFVRFYYSYFLVITGILYFSLTQLSKVKTNITDFLVKFSVLVILPIGFYNTFISMYAPTIELIGGRTNVFIGSFRYFVTPFPLNVDPTYYFLTIASICHWLLLPFLPIGFYYFLKKYFYELMPYLILFLMITIFYGSFDELQGPRHRVPQVVFISIIQSYSIKEIVRIIRNRYIINKQYQSSIQ